MRIASWFNRRRQGDQFEARARAFLEAQRLQFVTANWHTAQGEIDFVMREQETLIFVEVRQRNSGAFGGARLSIDPKKQARFERTVEAYLSKLPSRPAYRLDAVVFDGGDAPQWIQNVFA